MAKLKSFLLTKTKHGNSYVFDREKTSVLLCNDVLYHLLTLVRKGIDVKKWIDGFEKEPITIAGCSYSKEELEYAFKKYLFLKEAGYFSQHRDETFSGDYIKPEMVEHAIANSLQVTFEVTERCNLKCEYCGYGHFYGDYDQRTGNDLDIDVAKKLLTYLLKLWNSPLNISHGRKIFISFYGGEPLLNIPFIKEIVRFMKGLDILHNVVEFTMTTNAVLLDKYMDFLVENDFGLLISLDGNEKNSEYRIFKNGKPSFSHIIKNIKALEERYPSYFKERVNFNAVLHNLNSVSEIYDFIKKNFRKTPRIAQLDNVGVRLSKQKDFWKMFTTINESLYSDMKESIRITKDMFINLPDVKSMGLFLLKYSGFVYEDYAHLLSPREYQKKVPTGTCVPFSNKIFVTANGKLLPCENVGHQFALGTVTPKKVELDFAQIARKYNDYYEKISRKCSACYNKVACEYCILNLPFADDNPTCLQVVDHKIFSDYIAAHLTQFEKEPSAYTRIMEEVTIG